MEMVLVHLEVSEPAHMEVPGGERVAGDLLEQQAAVDAVNARLPSGWRHWRPGRRNAEEPQLSPGKVDGR